LQTSVPLRASTLGLTGFAADELATLLDSFDRRDRREREETFDGESALADHPASRANRGRTTKDRNWDEYHDPAASVEFILCVPAARAAVLY
jgi:hypothetical protein